MQVEYAFLADAAQTSADNKLYVLGGGIDEIGAPRFPATHPYMSLVVKLQLHPTECGRPHKLEIELWEQDGQRIGGRIEAEFSAERQKKGRSSYVQMVLNIVGIQFPHSGDYAFQLVVGGEHRKTVPLHLEELPQPSSAADSHD
jgi:hypothetical protein